MNIHEFRYSSSSLAKVYPSLSEVELGLLSSQNSYELIQFQKEALNSFKRPCYKIRAFLRDPLLDSTNSGRGLWSGKDPLRTTNLIEKKQDGPFKRVVHRRQNKGARGKNKNSQFSLIFFPYKSQPIFRFIFYSFKVGIVHR